MFGKKFISILVFVMSVVFLLNSVSVSAASNVLKKNSSGSQVTALQKNLAKLGYFSESPTGFYGEATCAAVKKLQKKYGYNPDGIAGNVTLTLIKKLLGGKTTSTSTKTTANSSYMLPWSTVKNTFSIGTVATVYDIKTGLSFKVKRTYGHNHADCEALTAKDTTTMKKIFGGKWSWDKRAVVVTVEGKKIAASIAGMPHAGIDKYAANRTVSSRSGGYGRGENLDKVKGNNMNGVFDIHFYGSKTHASNRTDTTHQRLIKVANSWALKKL